MGLLSGILKTAINVAVLPVDIVRDVVETSIGSNEYDTLNVAKRVEKLCESVEESMGLD